VRQRAPAVARNGPGADELGAAWRASLTLGAHGAGVGFWRSQARRKRSFRRKLTEEQQVAAAALMDQYVSALGDFAGTPLGLAGADRMRGGAEAYAG
jgi:hypothetical protein